MDFESASARAKHASSETELPDVATGVSRILIIDDDPAMCEWMCAALANNNYSPRAVESGEQGLSVISQEKFDVVVADVRLPGINGIGVAEQCRRLCPELPVIISTGHGTMEVAISAIRAGAYDFVTKPIDEAAFLLAVARATEYRRLQRDVRRLRAELAGEGRRGNIVGASQDMKKIYAMVERLARSEPSVLLTGETGTGKEIIARHIHESSPRASGRFVAVNCAALPDALLESELFGHVKGAFTDARSDRAGLFSEANNGTLFLDEIGDMPITVQPKLLRVLQEGLIRPVGADKEFRVNVRIISATKRDLESLVADNRFREDLFFRLNVVHLELPPLRSRGTDILLLAQSFLERFTASSGKEIRGFSAATAKILMAYDWPGNVRELQNCVERAVALGQFEEIQPDDLPERVTRYTPTQMLIHTADPHELLSMETIEKRYIGKVLNAVDGNKSRAARILGFDRKTLYRKLSGRITEN